MSASEIGAKTLAVKFKTDGLADGEFIGYASIFGNIDETGDKVIPGAFGKNIGEWESKDVPIPIYWEHNTSDPDFNLGFVVEAVEDERGLRIHGRLDMESPKSPQSHRLIKSGRVNQMSYAYKVIDSAFVTTEDGESYRELRELELFEVSIVPIGANQQTEILAVKAAARSLCAKAGRVLSAKNTGVIRGVAADLKSAAAALEDVLTAAGGSDEEDQDQTSGKEPSPETEKSSDVTTLSPSVSLALQAIDLNSKELVI